MNKINKISDVEIDEIINGCVDGVYPTSHEVSMALEIKSIRAYLAALIPTEVKCECDQDVYANGEYVCRVSIPKETAEVICRSLTAVTGHKVDWHYFGGWVVIKALAPAPSIPAAVPEAMPDSVYEILRRECGNKACLFSDELWNACRAAMLQDNLNPAGWKLVPATATPAMARAGGKAAREYLLENGGNSPYVIYEAMVAAAPKGV